MCRSRCGGGPQAKIGEDRVEIHVVRRTDRVAGSAHPRYAVAGESGIAIAGLVDD
jgi:hypothetical protein